MGLTRERVDIINYAETEELGNVYLLITNFIRRRTLKCAFAYNKHYARKRFEMCIC